MIFVDSNVPMYLVGAEHPNKSVARRLLESFISREIRLVTDAEVLEEILDRYAAIGRTDAIEPIFRALLGLVDEVLPVERSDVEKAKDILKRAPKLPARDALHVAIPKRYDVSEILSFDSGFDAVAGIARIAS